MGLCAKAGHTTTDSCLVLSHATREHQSRTYIFLRGGRSFAGKTRFSHKGMMWQGGQNRTGALALGSHALPGEEWFFLSL